MDLPPVPKNYEFLDREPNIHPSCFIAKSADVMGDVTIGEESSVWFQCVLRGDINRIEIGARTNIQDGTVIHLADKFGTFVGDWVTVGHKALLHACTVEDEVLIGMGAIVMDGAVVGSRSIVGAGALVTPGTEIPPGSLVLGSPAKVKRTLDPDEQAKIRVWAQRYVATSREYLKRGKKLTDRNSQRPMSSQNGVIEIGVRAVLPTSGGCAVFLGTEEKVFVIYVDQTVGAAITMFMRATPKPRPQTHDLIADLLLSLGAKVDRVIINDFHDGVYYARLIISCENELHDRKIVELDARPSDSMAMAIQQGAPVYITDEVWEEVEDMSEVLEKMEEQGFQEEDPESPGTAEH